MNIDRTTKALLTVLAVGVWGLLLKPTITPAQAQGVSSTVKAPFTVTDETGKTIFSVDTLSGRSVVSLFGKRSSPALLLAATQNGGGMTIQNGEGEHVAFLSAASTGGPSFELRDRNGKRAIELYANPPNAENGRGIRVFAPNNEPIATLSSASSGSDDVGLVLSGADTKVRALLLYHKSVGTKFGLFDGNEKPLFEKP